MAELGVKLNYGGKDFKLYVYPEMRTNKKTGKKEPVDSISRRIWENKQFYEIDKIEDYLKFMNDDAVVFDCGANIGNHSVFWGAHCKEVHAFEAFPSNYKLLKRNMKENNIGGQAYRVLLGNTPGKYKVVTTEVSRGATCFEPDPNGEYTSMRLDDVVDESVKPTFVKIDVEGDELELLKGASRILEESHPVLWIEIHYFYHDDMDDQVLAELAKYGYEEGVDVFLTRRTKKKK